MRTFRLVGLFVALVSALPALAGPRVAIVGIHRDYSAGAARDRLLRGLRESELSVATVDVVEAAVGVSGAATLAECLLERNRACATAPALRGVEALAVAELSQNGRTGRLVATTAEGAVLFDHSLSATNLPALLDALEVEAQRASRAISVAFHDAPLLDRHTAGWGAVVLGVGFGAASAIFANSANVQAGVLGRRYNNAGPISPVHAYLLEQGMGRDATLAVGLGAAGVLAATAGLHLLWMRPGALVHRVEVAPTGHGLVVNGSFQ